MQRPIWKGHIVFGLVSIPVTLYSAEKRSELHFHLLDSRNKSRIHYERINDETGKEVPWDEIVKAYEVDTNNYIILHDEDFKRAAPKAAKSIDIEDFVDLQKIDNIYFERPYYLIPDKFGEKGYVLLREVLKKTKKVGIAKVVIRAKQYLSAVIAHDTVLILNLLRFPQEIQSVKEYELPNKNLKTYRISDKELNMASQLIEAMTADWRPERYHDDYREALLKWIEEKATKHKIKHPKKEKEVFTKTSGNIIDFMELLKKSINKSKKSDTAKKSNKKKKIKRAAKHK